MPQKSNSAPAPEKAEKATKPEKSEKPSTFDTVMDRAGAKEKAKLEKHLEAADAEGSSKRGELFRKVATMLGSHSPLPVQSSGKQAWQYFIPDGKYRMQVFALEDPGDGTLQIYLPDILDAAVKKKVLKKTPEPDHFIAVETGTKIRIDALDSANTPQPPPHYKHMLGWNRKALRITIPTSDDGTQVTAASKVCAVAAQVWANVMSESAAKA